MALEQREIKILLSFTNDPASRQAIEKAFNELEGGFRSVRAATQAYRKELAALATEIAKVEDPQRRAAGFETIKTLRLTGETALKSAKQTGSLNSVFVEQRENVRAATEDVRNYNRGLQDTTKTTGDLRQSMRGIVGIAMLGFGLQMAGRQLQGLGRGIFGAATGFVEQAPEADRLASRWRSEMERIEASQVRMGRVMTAQIIPYLEKIADLAEKAADFAEQHPEIVKAVAGLAAGTFVAGAAMMGIGLPLNVLATGMQLTMLPAIMGSLGGGAAAAGAGGAAAAGAGMGIAPMVAIAGAVILALVAGGIIAKIRAAEGIRENEEQSRRELELLKQWQSKQFGVGAPQFEELRKISPVFTISDLGAFSTERIQDRIKQLEEALNSMGDAAGEATEKLPVQAIQAFIAYRRAEAEAATQYNERRNEIEEQYAAQRVEIEQRYEQQRTDLIQSFAKQQAQALEQFNFNQARQARDFAANESRIEEDYYLSRTQALADYHESVRQAEQDFQRQMREMRLDHEQRLEDLIASRDVVGILREMRSYERQRSQATEEHAVEMQRMKADAADRLREMEAQFAREKARRLEDYSLRLADQQEDFQRQQAQQRAAFQERLAEMEKEHRVELQKLKQKNAEALRELDSNYRKEKAARYKAFIEQLRDLELFTGRLKTAWDKFYSDMEVKLRDFIAKAEEMTTASGTATSGRQHGGYVNSGLYRLHSGEYVLSRPTTRRIERMVGGGLTQGRLVGALGGGGGVVIENINFPNTTMSQSELTRFMRDKFPDLLADSLSRARGRIPL
jgi:hypothetical protein